MKIWHLVSNRWNSAISEYALSAARATKDLGADVLVTPMRATPLEVRLKDAGFEPSSVDHFGPGSYGRLSKIAASFMPDVIFTYGGPETTAAMILKRRSRLIRFHGYQSDGDQPILSAWARKLGHLHVDQVIAPSEFIASHLRGSLGAPVAVVTLGCDHKIFHFNDIARDPRPELLIFGRLDPVKGHREFLPVFRQVLNLAEAAGGPRPKLRVVGLAANISPVHIMAAAKEAGISDGDIEIHCQRVSNVSELMSKVSLGVVSSLGSEAICRVAQEFLLSGTPVVTTNAGSLEEVFIQDSFGAVYGSNSDPGAAKIIFDRLRESHQETSAPRQKRAADASTRFSLASMRDALKCLLTDS